MWHSIFWHRGRGPLADIRAKAFSPTIQCNVLHCIAQYIAPIAPRTLFTCLPGGRYLLVYIYIAACRFIFNNMTKYSDYTWTNITKESSPRFWWWMARNYLSLSFYSDLFLQMHIQLFCSVLCCFYKGTTTAYSCGVVVVLYTHTIRNSNCTRLCLSNVLEGYRLLYTSELKAVWTTWLEFSCMLAILLKK